MTYEELIESVLNGRSVNRAAKEMGIAQKSLDRYVKGERLPDYTTAAKFAREANVSLGDVMLIMVREEEKRKPLKEMVAAGFRLLTNALNRLFTVLSAA
ncbi:helix-turn-helix domain-containing protein [Trinickia fusca]|uniref:XRE family transcriptional regulator n=1 Tax=Trinickia fusca TaxID=2419777 RepID=A0A494X810_9BURK|nr:helix-turn-helix transcriptional regulator [Trinickia fusca]RKP46847.1 XRE family transcriptional regulator [Trinickia fusca]